MIDYSTFKQICSDHGKSMTEISEILGISLNGIKKAFDNESLKVRDLELLATSSGITVRELLSVSAELICPQIVEFRASEEFQKILVLLEELNQKIDSSK